MTSKTTPPVIAALSIPGITIGADTRWLRSERMLRILYIALIISVIPVGIGAQSSTSFGRFSGTPKTEWLEDGRLMRLLEDFSYYGPDGKTWTAKKGDKTDGASIPQAFWWLIGGPFEGRYRNAAIVHDSECAADPHRNGWREVHRMFYNASRAGGVSETKAKIMFMAVYHCGPRWEWKGEKPPYSCFDRDTFVRGVVAIRRNPTLSLDAIESFTAQGLENQVSDSEMKSERERLDHGLINGSNRAGMPDRF